MGSRISDGEFYGWVADMTGEMAKLSRSCSPELACALDVANIVAKGVNQPTQLRKTIEQTDGAEPSDAHAA